MGESYLSNLIALAAQDPERAAAAAGWGSGELAVWSMSDGRRITAAVWLLASTDRRTADEIIRALLDLEAEPGWWSTPAPQWP